ncbi:MAG: hypothetical protein V4649_11975 [Bacteroidota bacterium]
MIKWLLVFLLISYTLPAQTGNRKSTRTKKTKFWNLPMSSGRYVYVNAPRRFTGKLQLLNAAGDIVSEHPLDVHGCFISVRDIPDSATYRILTVDNHVIDSQVLNKPDWYY